MGVSSTKDQFGNTISYGNIGDPSPYAAMVVEGGMTFSDGSNNNTANVAIGDDGLEIHVEGSGTAREQISYLGSKNQDGRTSLNIKGVAPTPINVPVDVSQYNSKVKTLVADDSNKTKYAQSIHIAGVAKPLVTGLPVPLATPNMNYSLVNVHGDVTNEVNMPRTNPIPTALAKYAGEATYGKFNSTDILSGTSRAEVDFGNKVIKNLNVNIPDPASGAPVVDYTWNDLAINGNHFQSTGQGTNNFNLGSATNAPNVTSPQTGGFFYGQYGDAIGGTYYGNDGSGTYLNTKQDN